MTQRQKQIVLALVGIVFLVWFLPKASEWLAVDKCLDGGGAWNYAEHRCEH